ncbi:hypothetical protein ACJX0J_006541, partial [Zea mays]
LDWIGGEPSGREDGESATGEGDAEKGPDAGDVPPLLPRPMEHPHHRRPTQPDPLHAWLRQAPPHQK